MEYSRNKEGNKNGDSLDKAYEQKKSIEKIARTKPQ